MMLMLRQTHRPNTQHRQPKVPLRILRRDLRQEVALPADVVGDVHQREDGVRDPDDQEDDPVSRAGGVVPVVVGDRPGDHADEGGGLGVCC